MTPVYYIYYRIAAGRESEAHAAVGAMQAQIHARTGIAGQLLARRDDPSTWMEIYGPVADEPRFASTLADAVASSGFNTVLAPGSQRVTEVFSELRRA